MSTARAQLGVDLAIERLVLDGIDLPADAAHLRGLVETELRRILDGAAAARVGAAELRPIVLSAPPDVPALARALAERIAAGAAAAGAWDG